MKNTIANMTEGQLIRVTQDMDKYAGEKVNKVEVIRDTLYVFASELACFRIAYQYRNRMKDVRVGYSDNLNTFYFRLEPNQ